MIDVAALLAAALGRRLDGSERLAVAVSGGPDSLGLLSLCVAAFPGRVTALTVDHGLRAASAAEAATVGAQCRERHIPHQILRWDGAKPGANVQAAARAARYRLLGGWCAAHDVQLLLTAHHADDQAETLLMRLNRASGSGGLAGIRPRRHLPDGVTLVRPLLGVRRAELADVARLAGWSVVTDPANSDDRFDRTAVRRLLASDAWLDAGALSRSAGHLAAAEAALDWAAARAWLGNVRREGSDILFDAAGLPDEIRRRVAARILAELAPGAAPRGGDIAALVARLAQGRTATLGGVQGRGGPLWRFRIVPRHRTNP